MVKDMARRTIERNIAYDDIKNKYYVTLHYGMKNGKQIKKTETFAKKRDAQKRLRVFEGEREEGKTIMPNSYTLGEWLDFWLDYVVSLKCAKTTYAGYRFIVDKHIKPELGNIKLQDLNSMILTEYFATKQKEIDEKGRRKISDNTLRKHHVLLLSTFRNAIKRDIIKKSPLSGIDPPIYTKPDIAHYNVTQVHDLLKKVDDDYILKPTVYLAVHAGMRRSEIAGLQWSSIDFDNNLISVNKAKVRAANDIVIKEPKNKKSKRKIFMTDELAEALIEVREMQIKYKDMLGDLYKESDYVVVNQYGGEVNPGYLSTLFGRFIKKHNLPDITLHGLRHTTASILLNAGVPLVQISDILGHADLMTTKEIYGHWEDETHKITMQKFGDMLKID